MKKSGFLNELEASILQGIIKRRNKSAHPSGHIATAEEARYVFSESILKFLSKDLRETSYIVDDICSRLKHENFFPSSTVRDIERIVESETERLHPSAESFLLVRLSQALESSSDQETKNSRKFLIGFSMTKDSGKRSLIVNRIFKHFSSKDTHVELISELISCDPALYDVCDEATKLRINRCLLEKSSTKQDDGYTSLSHPLHVLCKIAKVLGEDRLFTDFKDFYRRFLSSCPIDSQIVSSLRQFDRVKTEFINEIINRISSTQFKVCNRAARSLPYVDTELAATITDEDAYRIVVAIERGASNNGFGPMEVRSNNFSKIPSIFDKAKWYFSENPTERERIYFELMPDGDFASFEMNVRNLPTA